MALAFWLGGLTFYAAVVIPAGHRVLGSHTLVGMVTQQVTHGVNAAAVIALAASLWNLANRWSRTPRRLRGGLAATWVILAVAQLMLFLLHPVLDGLIDAQAHVVLDGGRFYGLHRVYLIGTTIQIMIGVAHAGCVLAAWQDEDRLRSGSSSSPP
jgi:hypothetical protein